MWSSGSVKQLIVSSFDYGWARRQEILSACMFMIVAIVIIPQVRQRVVVRLAVVLSRLWLLCCKQRNRGNTTRTPNSETNETPCSPVGAALSPIPANSKGAKLNNNSDPTSPMSPGSASLASLRLTTPMSPLPRGMMSPMSPPVDPSKIQELRQFKTMSHIEQVRFGTFALYKKRLLELKECTLLIKDPKSSSLQSTFEFARGKVQLSRNAQTFKIVNSSSEILYIYCNSDELLQKWMDTINHNLQVELAFHWSSRTRAMKLQMETLQRVASGNQLLSPLSTQLPSK